MITLIYYVILTQENEDEQDAGEACDEVEHEAQVGCYLGDGAGRTDQHRRQHEADGHAQLGRRKPFMNSTKCGSLLLIPIAHT